jgi:hypothetical protein
MKNHIPTASAGGRRPTCGLRLAKRATGKIAPFDDQGFSILEKANPIDVRPQHHFHASTLLRCF